MRLNIESEQSIYKIGDRVFLIDDDNNLNKIFNNTHFCNIVSILDKGFRFIPCFHFSIYSIFVNLLKEFENNLSLFNSNFFLKKQSASKKDTFNVTSRLDSCNDINCFYKNKHNKRKIDFEKLPFQKESLDFKFNFFKESSNLLIKTKHNLSTSEFNSLNYFVKNKPFCIVECDKNIGATLISN